MTSEGLTLPDRVRRRAAGDSDRIAYTFLVDGASDARSITWSQLHGRANALAASLLAHGASGQPVLLALPSGLAFVESLIACWYAGAIAVPVSLPRHHRAKHRLDGIIANAGARIAIATADVQQRLTADSGDATFAALAWIDVAGEHAAADVDAPTDLARPAVLQYTSGSTGTPRGVIVTHANLMRNCAMGAEACGHDETTTMGGWLPLFHDMGLVGMIAAMAFTGGRCVFMSPERFLMRPASWLKMIADYRLRTSPAPNFAYDLCVDKVTEQQKAELDLSCWQNALNGSEPVRPATLSRFAKAFASCGFRSRTFFPCYGLAEATLLVTGPSDDRRAARRLADGTALPDGADNGHVGCGRIYGDARVAIVDPLMKQRVADGAIGEIWVAGESVAAGYWNDPIGTAATFHALLDGEDDTRWLRTGDLGRVADNDLFITGRLRELIIVAGRNFFPVDLERTAEAADAAIAPSGVAAFSADVGNVERLVIVAEVRRERGRANVADDLDVPALARQIRAAVTAEHEVAPYDVVIARPGALPRTTSGKLSRCAARDAYLNKTLARLETCDRADVAA